MIFLSLPIPDLSESQIKLFNLQSLQAKVTGQLDPLQAVEALKKNIGKEILVFDIGATALKYLVAMVNNDGKITIDEQKQHIVENKGRGINYLDILIQAHVDHSNLPVAISTAGLVSHGELISSANLPIFVEQLKKAGGFSTIFKTDVPVMNDAEAGLIAGAIGVASREDKTKPIIYVINGGGIGGAVMDADNKLWALEPGHIQVVDELNTNHVTRSCGSDNKQFVCIERVGASGMGVEQQWEEKYGTKLDGKSIAEKMYFGDPFALQLYDTAALLTAHVIEGMRATMKISASELAVVLHGGLFKTEGIVERIEQILSKHHNQSIDLIPTKALGFSNACMTGLAIAAVT